MIVGAWVSVMVTVKEHVAELVNPLCATARKVTVVVPMGKSEPEPGPAIWVIVGEALQLSVAVGLGKFTFALH